MREELFYTIFLLLSATVSGSLAALVWWRARKLSTGPALTAFMLSLMWWSGTYALHWTAAPRPYPNFWLNITYFGCLGVPVSAFLLALRFTNRHNWINPITCTLLAIEPIITLVALFSDPGNGIFFGQHQIGSYGRILTDGPVFLGNLIYSYLLMLFAFVLFAREFVRSVGVYRRQLVVILTGALASWFVNIVGMTGLNPLPALDPTSFSFTITGLFLAYGVFRYQILDVVPVARHMLVERMNDGVLVLDAKGRIVDANAAFARMFDLIPAKMIGLTAASVLKDWVHLVEPYRENRELNDELFIARGHGYYYDVRMMPLRDRAGATSGRLVVVRDVTVHRRDEQALREANSRLQTQLSEITSLQDQLREQALRDPLTGLFNRRYLEETLERELARATREGTSVSIASIDVDFFKRINDTYGHPAGDQMLQELGKLLLTSTRTGDVVSRFGGEEFVIVLPGATSEQARARIDDCRLKFEHLRVPYEGLELRATFSSGIASFPADCLTSVDLLRLADRALYSAKQGGRNIVVSFSMLEPASDLLPLAPIAPLPYELQIQLSNATQHSKPVA